MREHLTMGTDEHCAVSLPGRRSARALVLAALLVSTGCGNDTRPGTVSALRSADGTVVWERRTEPAPVEVLTDGRWVVTLGFRGCDNSGQLAVLDAVTGDEQWSIATVGGFGPRQIALAGDVVVNSSDGVVTALDVDRGAERWSREDLPGGSLLVAGATGSIVIGVHDFERTPGSSRLLSVDPTDGTMRWDVPLDGLGQVVDVAIVGELVVARLSGTGRTDAGRTSVVAVGLADGTIRWQRDLGTSEIVEPLMVAEEHVVVALRTYSFTITDDSGNLVDELAPSASIVVLDTATGDERWRVDREFDLVDDRARDVQAMDTDETVVIARDGEQLVALDAATGAPHWSTPGSRGGAWIVGMLVLSVPTPWIDGRTATLEGIDRASGATRWSRTTNGATARAIGVGDLIFTVDYGRQPSCD
jgi:outer membrane protein assembly factor BamB